MKSIISTSLLAASLALPVQAESTFESIKSSGSVTVATEAAFPPFEFVEDGKIVGYGKDLLTEIVTELDVELEQLDLPWPGVLPGLIAGKFDFVATTVAINEERAKKYAFTMPIADGQPYFVTRKGETLSSEDDLAGLKVGTQLASFAEPIARALDERLSAKSQGYAELKLYPTFPDAYVGLASGEVDAVIQALPSLAVLVRDRPNLFELGQPVTTGVEYTYLAWVTRPADLDLRDYLSAKLKEMRDDGRMGEFQKKWFGFEMDIPTEGYLPEGAF
ncbi:transporter substrate-binding domain-containing protein [Cognatishimia maritima]|uniref:Amino acid ABC transporter substrate-binding protein, PAAT family (TC 3.A.1.3.-) n=1 Tax=Cognatishimia maritima TaxID=870908 RepID=A0A1M5QBA5_9RHOB|nr:transporter substrate-binding domain-containing protein [Cognatishimia maritima]SHH11312.1 amino acid ABC transporter substrate-binding protein, PAAT family (TC 3.A.1.3.-) [Cognatishimia maritima]